MGGDGERISLRQAEAEERGVWGSPPRTREQNAMHREWARTRDLRALAGCTCDTCGAARGRR